MPNLLDSIFIFISLCFLIEQAFYRFMGSYPYRYGFVVQKIPVSSFDINYWDLMKCKLKELDVKISFDKTEVYLKYKYPPSIIGPALFVGQIKAIDSHGIIHIKVGPLSTIFVLFLIMYPFFSLAILEDATVQIMNILFIVIIIAYFYFRLLNPINRIISQQ